MSKIAIITDSTSDIPEDMVKELDLKIIPLTVNFGEESFLDNGKDINKKDFYNKVRSSEKLPTTTQPTPKNFIELYSDTLKTSDSIISIHISKKMSGTINSAEMARKELPGRDIEIIDSELVHMPLGFLAIKAAQLAQQGRSKEEILKEVYDLKPKITVLIVPSTLEYLKKGGRIGKAKGLIASLLEIKPILTIHDGEISQFKTARRWNQVKTELINSMKTMIKNYENLIVSVGHADAKDDAAEMYERIKETFNPKKIINVDIGIVVGTHLGPGGLGITFYEE